MLDLAARWQKDTLAPDVLSIIIGINDTFSVCCGATDKPGISVDRYSDVYDKLLKTTLTTLPKVRLVMCGPFTLPGRANAQNSDRFKKDVEARQAVVATLARRYDAVLVRLQGVFDTALRRAPAPYWIWDDVHPTYAGHQLIADQWLRAVDAAHVGGTLMPKKSMD